jgi:hypothetical protein
MEYGSEWPHDENKKPFTLQERNVSRAHELPSVGRWNLRAHGARSPGFLDYWNWACLTTDGRLCHHLQISRGGVAALWNGRNRVRVRLCVCVPSVEDVLECR